MPNEVPSKVKAALKHYPLVLEWLQENWGPCWCQETSEARAWAAGLMILYSAKGPSAFSLKEIGDMVGSTEGTIKVWRTEWKFLELMFEAEGIFALYLLHWIRPAKLLRRQKDLDKTIAVLSRGAAKSLYEIVTDHETDVPDEPTETRVLLDLGVKAAMRADGAPYSKHLANNIVELIAQRQKKEQTRQALEAKEVLEITR